MTRKVGIYCRISQDRVGAGLGVERQEIDCRDLAERLGWPVLDVYVDNDTSAYGGRPRPGYERLLTDVEGGHVGAVIAWHVDRLHRSPVELERYIGVCDPRGVPTHTVRAGALDLSTASGRMTARITGAVARHESEQKGERVRRQKQQAQADGRWLGGRRPFGYLGDGVTPHPVEGPVVTDATRRIVAGDSLHSICREWNTRGLTTTTGAAWTASRLRQMLARPRNAGLIGNGNRIMGDASWPALVDRDMWDALRYLLSDPARRTHTGVSRRLVGSFLYRCECGELVRSGGNGAKGQPRYACPTGHLRRAADPIDDLVFRVIAGVLVRDGVQLLPAAADVAPLRERRAALRTRAEEIAALLGDPTSGMTAEQFRTANERVQAETRAVEDEIARRSARSVLAGIADADDPGAALYAADVDRKRAVIGDLATVTLMRSRRGRRTGGYYFEPSSVRVEPREPQL